MLFRTLPKEQFPQLVGQLLQSYEVVGPKQVTRRQDGKPVHQLLPVTDFAELDLDYESTEYSAKTYFLPYRESLSSFTLHPAAVQAASALGLSAVCHNPFMSHVARLAECLHVTHHPEQPEHPPGSRRAGAGARDGRDEPTRGSSCSARCSCGPTIRASPARCTDAARVIVARPKDDYFTRYGATGREYTVAMRRSVINARRILAVWEELVLLHFGKRARARYRVSSFLDVGAATGRLVAEFARVCDVSLGIECASWPRARVPRRLLGRMLWGDFVEHSHLFADDSFDLVFDSSAMYADSLTELEQCVSEVHRIAAKEPSSTTTTSPIPRPTRWRATTDTPRSCPPGGLARGAVARWLHRGPALHLRGPVLLRRALRAEAALAGPRRGPLTAAHPSPRRAPWWRRGVPVPCRKTTL